ncbi:MAG: YvcK family protein [Magnetococcales bacterium]|nr:YvcK family protein [Magnetococcales bacterium]
MSAERKIRVVMFCGGRGASNISTLFAKHSQTELTLLINAYDDGLSTGRMRAFIPGMLGPSDLRKNISLLIPQSGDHHKALKTILEYRLPRGFSRNKALGAIAPFVKWQEPGDPVLAPAFWDLSLRQAKSIQSYLTAFLDYEQKQFDKGNIFDFGDCSVGNILFAGCYLVNGEDFNSTVAAFEKFAEIDGKVLNITDGQNLVLTALTVNGDFLVDESTIVSGDDPQPIRELFLLPKYLTANQIKKLDKMELEERISWLRKKEVMPQPNPNAIAAIGDADLIIYGPGTQNSSLFPSYLTKGIPDAIIANDQAEIVFIANIMQDYDIPNQTVQTLLHNLAFNMAHKGDNRNLSQLVTRVFTQTPDLSNINRPDRDGYLKFDTDAIQLDPSMILSLDWEDSAGTHHGGQLVDALLSIMLQLVDVKIHPYRHMVSIIVPVLNEAPTLSKVLRDLGQLDFSRFEVGKEIIMVDGGSTDGSLDKAKAEKYTRVFSLEDEKGRGAAMRLGIEKARGNVIAFFPADSEYKTEDLYKVVAPILENQYRAVFGSRPLKYTEVSQFDENIQNVYGTSRINSMISKYGGMLVSYLTLLLYNRYISDLFSTVKAYDGPLLKSLKLHSSGVDFESEVVAKLSRKQSFILEVPVHFRPRTKAAGKKMTIRDGLKMVLSLIIHRMRDWDRVAKS